MKKIFNKNNTGFTLIELLVVVSIIAILAAIILTNLSASRSQVSKTTYTEGMRQFSTLLELEYSEQNTYAGLSTFPYNSSGTGALPSFVNTTANCDTIYGPSSGKTSQYIPKALDLCKQIVNSSTGNSRFEIVTSALGTAYASSYTNNDKYSIQGFIDGTTLYCFGSSGKSLPSTNNYNGLGCKRNP